MSKVQKKKEELLNQTNLLKNPKLLLN